MSEEETPGKGGGGSVTREGGPETRAQPEHKLMHQFKAYWHSLTRCELGKTRNNSWRICFGGAVQPVEDHFELPGPIVGDASWLKLLSL